MGRAPLLGSIIEAASRTRLETLHRLADHAGAPLASALYRRQMVAKNLAAAFPALPDAAREALAEDFYRGFAQVCMEVLRARSMSAAELRQRVTISGAAPLNDGGLLLMAHHGNLVWAVNALAGELEVPVSVVYKLPHLPIMRELLLAIAHRFGVDPVPVKELRKRLVAARQQARVWTLVADQRPGNSRHTVRFCGRETAFHAGPERIARALKVPVYYLSCRRTGPGAYRCAVDRIAEPPFGEPGSVVEAYAARVQAEIDRAPADWLWSHDRWRE